MQCELCLTEITNQYGSGRFCSARCARAFSTHANRQSISARVSLKLKGKHPTKGSFKKGTTVTPTQRGAISEGLKRHYNRYPFEKLGRQRRRQRVIDEQNGRCASCNMDAHWNGMPLSFQVDHIDGDRFNNTRSNLQALCPNCHSQTSTRGVRKISSEEHTARSLAGRRKVGKAGFDTSTRSGATPPARG